MHESPGTCYQCYTTTGKGTQNPITLCLWESLEYLHQFQHIPHNIFTTYNSFYLVLEKHLTISTETHSNVNPPSRTPTPCPPKTGKKKGGSQKVNSSGFLVSFPMNTAITRLIRAPQSKKPFVDAQPPEYLKAPASAFSKNLHSVSVKPSVTHERHLGLF